MQWAAEATVETPGGPMPTFQAVTAISGGTGGDTRTWPTHQSGDVALLVAQTVGAEAAVLSTPAGFAEIDGSPQSTGTGTAGTRITVFWCRATSASMASPVFADAGDHIICTMITFRGCVASGDPWNTTAGDVKAVASTTLTYPSVTTTQDECLVVMVGTRDLDTGAAWSGLPVNVNLSSITEQFDTGLTPGVGGGIAIYTGGKSSAGAVGTSPATVTSSINAMMTIALKG